MLFAVPESAHNLALAAGNCFAAADNCHNFAAAVVAAADSATVLAAADN